MGLSSAEVYSPERSSDPLGNGWRWSERYVLRVRSDNAVMYIEGGSLWFNVRHSKKRAMRVDSNMDFPVAKMIMLTREARAIRELTERFKSG